MDVTQELETLLASANDVYVVRYTCTATLTLLLYEYVMTMEEEIRLVWPARLSFIKITFFLNRDMCKHLLFALSTLDLFVFIIGEIVLLTRVYAIWFGKRWMLLLLLSVYIPGITVSIYASVHVALGGTAATFPALFGNGCLVNFVNREFWICYIVLLSHETLMLGFILAKAIIYGELRTSVIFNLLVKDGILYYFCVLLSSVANLVVLLRASSDLCSFLILTQGLLHSILCTRLLLRLRGAYESMTTKGLRSIRIQTASSRTLQVDLPMQVLKKGVDRG